MSRLPWGCHLWYIRPVILFEKRIPAARFEIFRFMTIRPPQEVDPDTAAGNAVDLNEATSDFLSQLRNERQTGSPAAMRRTARQYAQPANTGFLDVRRKLDERVLRFHETAARLRDPDFRAATGDAFARIFDVDPPTYATSQDFDGLLNNVANSIVAAAIDPDVSQAARSLLVRLAKEEAAVSSRVRGVAAMPRRYPRFPPPGPQPASQRGALRSPGAPARLGEGFRKRWRADRPRRSRESQWP